MCHNIHNVCEGNKFTAQKRMRHLLICPISYKELYESNLQLIVNLLQREGVETILFSVSDGCTLTS